MNFGSICSGIEAASIAWDALGWRCRFVSEIAPFPRAVLSHRFPEVPLHGDFTTIRRGDFDAVDLIVGGTPCQSFSVAGLRGGMADGRGNLSLEYIFLLDRLRPRWMAWENVPGVFTSGPEGMPGEDFRCFLSGLVRWDVTTPDGGWKTAGIIAPAPVDGAYGLAWRVLDAQFVRVDGYARAVPQRRRRVFVVGHLRDWRRAAAVLFEQASMCGDSAPRRKAGQETAANFGPGPAFGGGELIDWPAEVAPTLYDKFGEKSGFEGQHVDCMKGGLFVPEPLAFTVKDYGQDVGEGVAPTLRAGEHDTSHANAGVMPAVCFDTTQITSQANRSTARGDTAALAALAHPPAIAFAQRGRGEDGAQIEISGDVVSTIRGSSGGSSRDMVAASWRVRRLTPRECERLQGLPDDFTLVPYRGRPAPDGPRYQAIGNSMAVNVMRWIGRRIETVERMDNIFGRVA